MIGSMVCQPYGFLKKPNVNNVWYESVAGGNFLNILKFHQQKTN